VLGPLEIEVDGIRVEVGGPLARRCAAALVSAGGTVVSDSVLAELVWGASPPDNVFGGVRVLVSRLRSVLGPAGGEVLGRVGSGYRLAVAAEATDVGSFAGLVDSGVRLLAGGEPDRAAGVLESALGLWRGGPWPELGDAPLAESARARLVELREVALEGLQAARLELGQTAIAVATLSEMVIAAPYRERRWELLALGLYRAGRQGHALAELRRVRQLLANELGIKPGPALRELERRMLTQDPTLLGPATAAQRLPQQDFTPPPRRSGTTTPRSSLVGRAGQLQLLSGLLVEQRLVTLWGPAGVGKTRLALEHVAALDLDRDVWQVELAAVHTVDDVVGAVAAAVGVIHLAGDLVGVIRHAVAGRAGLLVLDNCEHLIAPIAELALRLLTDCPELRILATSREPLGMDGEHTLLLEPLPVRGPLGGDGAAVELLVDRVRLRRAGWTPTGTEREAVREICRMLDGLPLAIELAAARERAFGLGDIAVHLTQRLDVLATAPKNSINPHRGLQAAIGWSVEQLDPADRAMLLRLWPFEGGFSWQAAHAVQPADTEAVLAVLASLVDRSVITADTSSHPSRYRMLETIRRYCRDHDPNPDATQETHAAWVRALVAEHATELTGPPTVPGIQTIRAEVANIRAGITHDLAHQPLQALRTATALDWTWVILGTIPEGTRLIRAALDACPTAATEDRASALLALSLCASHAGDPADGLRLAEVAEKLLEKQDPVPGMMLIKAMMCGGIALAELGDLRRLRAYIDGFRRQVEIADSPERLQAVHHGANGLTLRMEGQHREGFDALRTCRELSQRCGAFWEAAESERFLAIGLLSTPGTDAEKPDINEVLAALHGALRTYQQMGHRTGLLAVIYLGAYALAGVAAPETVVRLSAAVSEHSRRIGSDPRRSTHIIEPGVEQRISQLLPDPQRSAAEHAGKQTKWAEMIELFTDTTTLLSSRSQTR
jgi:predicted ATPase/DNA-binding SARP family transcriptional activator